MNDIENETCNSHLCSTGLPSDGEKDNETGGDGELPIWVIILIATGCLITVLIVSAWVYKVCKARDERSDSVVTLVSIPEDCGPSSSPRHNQQHVYHCDPLLITPPGCIEMTEAGRHEPVAAVEEAQIENHGNPSPHDEYPLEEGRINPPDSIDTN